MECARRIERSIAYMTEHLNQPLRVAELAAQAEVSPSHFFALFKRQTGHPPINYFIRLRMRRACELLDSTAASVKEVAAALGYEDQFYFSRLFKSVNHFAPSRYLALHKPMPSDSGDQAAVGDERNGNGNSPAVVSIPRSDAELFNSIVHSR